MDNIGFDFIYFNILAFMHYFKVAFNHTLFRNLSMCCVVGVLEIHSFRVFNFNPSIMADTLHFFLHLSLSCLYIRYEFNGQIEE